MATTKLTLSVEKEIVEWARELSKKDGASISSIFSHYVRLRKHPRMKKVKLGPLTRRALKMGREIGGALPIKFDSEEAVATALLEKYKLSEK